MPTRGCLILAGERSNVITGAGLSCSSASAVPALADLEALRDGRNNRAFRFASASSEWVRADLRGLVNGGFESWPGGKPEGWTSYTTGGGVVAREEALVRAGSAALRLAKSAPRDVALVLQRTSVPAGARRRLSWALRAAPGASVGLMLTNSRTGRSLAPDGTWRERVNVAIVAGHAWNDGTLDFEVEPFTATGADLCELVVQVYAGSGTGDVWADELELLPVCDFVALSGHNCDPGLRVELFGIQRGAGGEETESLVARLEPYAPACYRRFPPAAYPAWRLRFSAPVPITGVNSSGPVWLAEWLLGAPYVGRLIKQGLKGRQSEQQVEQSTPAGQRTVYNRTVYPSRSLDLNWQLLSAAQLDALKGEIFERGRGGRYAACVVPYLDLEGDTRRTAPPEAERAVLLASPGAELGWSWPGVHEWALGLTLDELAFPAVDELVE